MEIQNRKYSLGIEYNRFPIDLNLLETELKASSLFAPTEPIKVGNNLIMETLSGNDVWFTTSKIIFQYKGLLEESYLIDAIKKSIATAKELETVTIEEKPLKFNPNFLSLDVGNFDSEEAFERDFGPTAQKLQKSLYGGGSVAYYQSSMDVNLYLGTEQEINERVSNTKGPLRSKKLEFEGETEAADSLDDLLVRLV